MIPDEYRGVYLNYMRGVRHAVSAVEGPVDSCMLQALDSNLCLNIHMVLWEGLYADLGRSVRDVLVATLAEQLDDKVESQIT